MKTAILADIHANLAALEAVLRDIDRRGGAGQYWFLGDTVDYGPQPGECIQKVRQLETISIIGNHDYAVANGSGLEGFQPSVLVVTRWTKNRLNGDEIDYLKKLPLIAVCGDFTLAHGSPRDPIWEYIFSESSAEQNLNHFQTRYCLVGHTHVPLCFQFAALTHPRGQAESEDKARPVSLSGWERMLRENRRGEGMIQLTDDLYIINPGSVGQPRDNDPRAAYAVYDSRDNTLEFRRVEYDVAATRQSMQSQGLPQWFSDRLKDGL